MPFKNPLKSSRKRESAIFLILGFLLIVISILFHTIHLIETKSKFLLFSNELFVQILSHIGIGCLAIGIISYILDLEHWTRYFETRLSRIVTNKDYLQKLNTQDLINLQTEVLKVYFKNDEIGGSDGFLKYYQKNIQKIIGMPFRVNVLMNLKIQDCISDKDKLEVFETMSYTCMSNSKKIQENICYLPEHGEHEETKDFTVILQHEELKGQKGDHLGKVIFDLAKLKTDGACTNINDGFNLSIKEYNKNGLNVIVKAHYLIAKHRFFAWRMSHPTHNLTLNINYPDTFLLAREYFFNENDTYSETSDDTNGSYILVLNDWLMPDEGVCIQLMPKKTAVAV